MILLDANLITAIITKVGANSKTITTDTLLVSSVTLDLEVGAIYAEIKRGTGTPFVENMDPVSLTVNPDGSFISSDGLWSGSLGSVAAGLIATLRTQFDQFILASGQVASSRIL
jgi:hypothetical protein